MLYAWWQFVLSVAVISLGSLVVAFAFSVVWSWLKPRSCGQRDAISGVISKRPTGSRMMAGRFTTFIR